MRTPTIIGGIKKARESTRPKQSEQHEDDPLGENPLEDLYQVTLGTHKEEWWELPEEKQVEVIRKLAKDNTEFRSWCAMHNQEQECVTGRESAGQDKITRFFWSKIHKQNGI